MESMENERTSADRLLRLCSRLEAINSRIKAMLPGFVLDQQAIWTAQISMILADIRDRVKEVNNSYKKNDIE